MKTDKYSRGSDTDTDRSVLVIDDEPGLAELYSIWLGDRYTVLTATDSETALEKLVKSVDVVLLDRRMPDRSGDDLLEEIRARHNEWRVAMVSALDPDFDIVETDVDDYICKPVSPEDLRSAVDGLMKRATVDHQLRKYLSLASKKAILDAEKSATERAASDEYTQLERELSRARERVDQTCSDLDSDDLHSLFKEIRVDD